MPTKLQAVARACAVSMTNTPFALDSQLVTRISKLKAVIIMIK